MQNLEEMQKAAEVDIKPQIAMQEDEEEVDASEL